MFTIQLKQVFLKVTISIAIMPLPIACMVLPYLKNHKGVYQLYVHTVLAIDVRYIRTYVHSTL